MLAITMFAFEALAVTTVMPSVIDDLGSVGLYGAVFSAFMLANLVSMVVGGHRADAHGPAASLSIGLVLFAAGLVLAGAAPSMAVLVLARIAQGAGAGAVGTTVYAIVGRGYPPEKRSRIFAITSAAWILPALVGPGVAGLVAEHLHWRLVFLGLLPLPAVVALLTLPAVRALPAGVIDGDQPGVVAAALRVALGAAALLAAVGSTISLPWIARVGLATGGIAVGVPALRRLLPAGTARARPGLPAAVASRALLCGAFFGTETFLPLGVTDVRGRSTVLAGAVLTFGSVAWSLGAFGQARLADRRAVAGIARLGIATVGIGVGAALVVLAPGAPVGAVLAAWSVAGLGMGLGFNSVTVYALDHGSPGAEGRTGASLQLADALAIALATGIGGAIVGAGAVGDTANAGDVAPVWLLLGVLAVASVAASRNLDGSRS